MPAPSANAVGGVFALRDGVARVNHELLDWLESLDTDPAHREGFGGLHDDTVCLELGRQFADPQLALTIGNQPVGDRAAFPFHVPARRRRLSIRDLAGPPVGTLRSDEQFQSISAWASDRGEFMIARHSAPFFMSVSTAKGRPFAEVNA